MSTVESHRRIPGPFRGATGILVALGLVVVLGAAVGLIIWRMQPALRTLTARFSQSVGIYVGSDVRVMGVKVGTITKVHPQGTTVAVTMNYDTKYKIPASTKAVIVPPSVVSDRYVQLDAYPGHGATLADDAQLSGPRAVVPLELDDVYKALNNLDTALGPNGANSNGQLSRLLQTGRANLQGNGENLHQTLSNLADALGTLSDNRQDLFGTVVNLQKFTTALAQSDGAVRDFNQQLATVSQQLAGERDDLSGALSSLAQALGQVSAFVKANRSQLTDNVNALTDLSGVLVQQQQAIREILDVVPVTLSNLNLAYNPRSGTLDTRDDIMGAYDPASYVCSTLVHLVPAKQVPQQCFQLAAMLFKYGQPLTNELKQLLSLINLPGVNLGYLLNPDPNGTTNGTGRVGQIPVNGETTPQSSSTGEVRSSDPTLGGILGGGLK